MGAETEMKVSSESERGTDEVERVTDMSGISVPTCPSKKRSIRKVHQEWTCAGVVA
jgi:hypothetical protein